MILHTDIKEFRLRYKVRFIGQQNEYNIPCKDFYTKSLNGGIIMVTTGLFFTFIVMAVAAVFTYVIQYKSVISPCYVEFDVRKIKELRLMAVYNKVTERSFKAYISLIAMAALFSYMTGNIIFALAGLYIQIIYFGVSMIVMVCMYYRSCLYWKRYA